MDWITDDTSVVYKLGCTTGLAHGQVSAIEVDDVVVDYKIGSLRFDRQIEVEGADNITFSEGGDSGSLIFDSQDFARRFFSRECMPPFFGDALTLTGSTEETSSFRLRPVYCESACNFDPLSGSGSASSL